jgi:hypothetical protein
MTMTQKERAKIRSFPSTAHLEISAKWMLNGSLIVLLSQRPAKEQSLKMQIALSS